MTDLTGQSRRKEMAESLSQWSRWWGAGGLDANVGFRDWEVEPRGLVGRVTCGWSAKENQGCLFQT